MLQNTLYHLVFAFLLAFLAYPASSKSPKNRVPISDWTLASIAAFSTMYLMFFYKDLSLESGMPTTADTYIRFGIILLLGLL